MLNSSNPNITGHGWWPSVKKVGLFGGDYPLAISYSDAYSQFTAASVTGSPFTWTPGNWGYGNGLPLDPLGVTTATIESLPDGTLINTMGGQFYGAPTGQVNFRWSNPPASVPPYIFLGQGSTAQWFPWSTTLSVCP